MAGHSPERVKRWFKKSASKQYEYAKSLTERQRGQLERVLEPDFSAAEPSVRSAAMTMWLAVQQARLRTHAASHQRHHNSNQFQTALWSVVLPPMAFGYRAERRRYYSSPLRPEYLAAFDNFMRVLGDRSIGADVRHMAAERLEYHWHSEETIARQQRRQLEQHGVTGLAEQGYRASTDPADVELTGQEREFVVHGGGQDVTARAHVQALEVEYRRAEPRSAQAASLGRQLDVARARAEEEARIATLGARAAAARVRDAAERDIAQQRRPLGSEIQEWLSGAKARPLANANAFDAEPNARAFARVLARRMPSKLAQRLAGGHHPVLADGAEVIHAIAQHPELRKEVFEMAETALGSCGDNLAEGFSNIVMAVHNHQIVEDLKRGALDRAGLESRMGQLFRLDALETEVHRFIENALNDPRLPERTRHRLTSEPLETMLHAKVALKASLGLPDTVPSQMEYERVSVLKPADLASIAARVRAKADDPAALVRFNFSNSIWRTGIQHLYPEFAELATRHQEKREAFRNLPLPPEGDEHVAEQADYAAQAAAIDAEFHAGQEALLRKFAGLDGDGLAPDHSGAGPSGTAS